MPALSVAEGPPERGHGSPLCLKCGFGLQAAQENLEGFIEHRFGLDGYHLLADRVGHEGEGPVEGTPQHAGCQQGVISGERAFFRSPTYRFCYQL